MWTVRWGNGYITTLLLEVFTKRNYVADFMRLKLNFIIKKTKNCFFEPPFGLLGVTYVLHLQLVGESMVDFLFIIIELFCYLLRLRPYKWKSVKVSFSRGWVILSANFRQKGALLTKHWLCQKTRVIALSCGIKISAVHCLILSQSTRVSDRLTDRQTDGWQTDRITTPKTAIA